MAPHNVASHHDRLKELIVTTSIFQQRRAGMLLHLSSVPGPHGIGDLGPGAFEVANWIAASGSTPVSYTHLTLPTNREV